MGTHSSATFFLCTTLDARRARTPTEIVSFGVRWGKECPTALSRSEAFGRTQRTGKLPTILCCPTTICTLSRGATDVLALVPSKEVSRLSLTPRRRDLLLLHIFFLSFLTNDAQHSVCGQNYTHQRHLCPTPPISRRGERQGTGGQSCSACTCNRERPLSRRKTRQWALGALFSFSFDLVSPLLPCAPHCEGRKKKKKEERRKKKNVRTQKAKATKERRRGEWQRKKVTPHTETMSQCMHVPFCFCVPFFSLSLSLFSFCFCVPQHCSLATGI